MTAPHDGRPRGARGFTLVEVLISIFIISILVAITVTVIPKVQRAAHGAQTQAQMTAIATAIQAYYGDFRAYPGPLPNSQVGITYYPTANYTASPQSDFVYVLDPNNSNAPVPLKLGSGVGTAETFGTFAAIQQITGAENLVLGLLGGLELTYSAGAQGSAIAQYAYNPANLFPDGTTPSPLGPMSLNPNSPKRLGAYLQVKTGDLSNSRSMGTPTVFTDEGGRMAADSPIPEFLDKYATPMPILYVRANVGGKAIAAVGGQDGIQSGNALTQTNADKSTSPVTAQYDIAQVLGYTQTPTTGVAIGCTPGNPNRDHHGLQGLGSMTDTVQGDRATPTGWYNAGKNALAYLKDPTTPGTSNAPDLSQTPTASGTPRQKDGFILISAGPDGLYGTPDDFVYPGGSLAP